MSASGQQGGVSSGNGNGHGVIHEGANLESRGSVALLRSQVAALPEVDRWEYLSVIVWDDDSKSPVTGDLEDVEVLNTLGLEGWELVCVVPLARTQVLEMAYPGNTRKLLAYFKRKIM